MPKKGNPGTTTKPLNRSHQSNKTVSITRMENGNAKYPCGDFHGDECIKE